MTDSCVMFPESFEKIAESVNAKIFELLHTGIALMSAKGYFLYCNKAFLEMFDLTTDVLGKHITDYFITGERGVMSTIRTRKSVICSSHTKTNAHGISFRYPIQDAKGHLCGVVVESIPTDIGKDKLLALLDTVRNLEQQSNYYEQKEVQKVGMLYTFESIIGESPAIEIMRCLGRRFACSQEPVLISGESGTGKELVAQALHRASPRSDRPFVSVNCAALPHELMESELFGYAAGAFTGAKAGGIKGKFEMADTGTIFLDEIGELPLLMQAKLLRVLESGEVQKIAHTGQPIHSDFRLIAATNRDLAELVRDGKFREDLYHRLNVFELNIPPLRNRVEDIPLLMQHFIARSVGNTRAQEIRVDNELYRVFTLYPWRGNIREFKNVLTYALYSLGDDGNVLFTKHLPARFMRELNAEPPVSTDTGKTEQIVREDSSSKNLSEVSARAERKVLEEALANFKYNKTLTAQALGISRNTLYRKLREYGLLSDTED